MKKLFFLLIVFFVFSAAHTQTKGNMFCFGNEPFWNLEITSDSFIFELLGGEKETFKYVEPVSAVGITTDYIKVYYIDKKANIILVIKNESTACGCTDGMSDFIYPYEVYLFKGDVMYYGCGRILD